MLYLPSSTGLLPTVMLTRCRLPVWPRCSGPPLWAMGVPTLNHPSCGRIHRNNPRWEGHLDGGDIWNVCTLQCKLSLFSPSLPLIPFLRWCSVCLASHVTTGVSISLLWTILNRSPPHPPLSPAQGQALPQPLSWGLYLRAHSSGPASPPGPGVLEEGPH